MRLLALLILISASCSWAADVTEKTACPELYSLGNLEPAEAQLPVKYELKNLSTKKKLLPGDLKETKAILKDTTGAIPIFFPESIVNDQQASLYYWNLPWRERLDKAFGNGLELDKLNQVIDGLDPKTRRSYLEQYVSSVLDYFTEKPDEIATMGKKPSREQVEATTARIAQLQKDPHQRELLIEALDSQFQEKVTRVQTRHPDLKMAERMSQVCGLFVGGCGALFFHYAGGDPIGMLAGGVLFTAGAGQAGITTLMALFGAHGPIRQALFKRAAKRALDRYVTEAGAEGARDWAWQKWKFTSQKVTEEAKNATNPEDAINAMGYRLLNTSTFLSSISMEELPNGERFDVLFKPGAPVSKEALQEILATADQRLEQLEIVRNETSQAQKMAKLSLSRGTDSAVLNQVAAAQLQTANQLAISAEIAKAHIKNIRNLALLAGEDQSKLDKLRDEIKALDSAVKNPAEGDGS